MEIIIQELILLESQMVVEFTNGKVPVFILEIFKLV
jgi:hypothetical protein